MIHSHHNVAAAIAERLLPPYKPEPACPGAPVEPPPAAGAAAAVSAEPGASPAHADADADAGTAAAVDAAEAAAADADAADAVDADALRRLPRAAETLLPDARIWSVLLGEPALSLAELAALTALARPRFVPQGGTVFSQQDPARALVFVRDGDAALGWWAGCGDFRVERPVRGPGWLDQSSAWLDATHAIDARAVSALVLVELPREEVQALLVTHPMLARRLIGSLAREAYTLAVSTHGLMHRDAPARFAYWLLERCQPMPERGSESLFELGRSTLPNPAGTNPARPRPRARSSRLNGALASAHAAAHGNGLHRAVVRLGERKRDIASQLAVTPETLSRLMRSLTRQGLISVAGYTVFIGDVEGLRRIANGH